MKHAPAAFREQIDLIPDKLNNLLNLYLCLGDGSQALEADLDRMTSPVVLVRSEHFFSYTCCKDQRRLVEYRRREGEWQMRCGLHSRKGIASLSF